MNTNTHSTGQANGYSKRPKGYKFKGDIALSTYRWRIFMNHQTTGEELIIEGYSKDVDSAEKADKQELLQDCISRLCNCGYLDKCWYWVIFKREFMGKQSDTMILEMNPNGFMAHDYLTLDVSTINFLERLYTARRTSTTGTLQYKDLIPARKTPQQKEKEDFTFSLEKFPDQTKLADYCRNVLLVKYSRNQVVGWYHKCVGNYDNRQQQPKPGAGVGGGDQDNERAAQLAQIAMQNLNSRFNKKY